MLLRTIAALLAGVALGLSFEPAGLNFLLPLAIAVFLWTVLGRSARAGALFGLVFGLAFMHTLLIWLRVVGTDAWLALASFQALYFALLGAGLAVVTRRRLWPFWAAVLWLAVEVFRSSWPMGGLTWGRVAFATIDTPFAELMPWIGANGVGLVVVLFSALLLWTATHLRRRSLGVLVGAAIAIVLLGLEGPPSSSDGTAIVAIVQGNVPGRGNDLIGHHREVTRSHLDLTRELAEDVARGSVERPDFVVWPENSTATDPFKDSLTRAEILEAVAAIQVPVLVGAIADAPDPDQVLNQGIVVDPRNGAGDRYTKRHPVPFGEYIPYRSHFGERNFGRLALIPRDMLSGTRTSPLSIDGILVADAICFDVAYDDEISEQVRGGAQLLVVQTSNAMFIQTGQIEQQFAISRLRAMETGRYVVVAAVNGRSGVIGPDGDVVAQIKPRTRDVLVQRVPLTSSTPPSMVIGPWLGRGSVVVALVSVLRGLLPYRLRRRHRSETGESA